jgi:hypothetical protein
MGEFITISNMNRIWVESHARSLTTVRATVRTNHDELKSKDVSTALLSESQWKFSL